MAATLEMPETRIQFQQPCFTDSVITGDSVNIEHAASVNRPGLVPMRITGRLGTRLRVKRRLGLSGSVLDRKSNV